MQIPPWSSLDVPAGQRSDIDIERKINIPKVNKIKAHSDNYYHNQLDEKIKKRFEDLNRTYPIRLNYNKIASIDYKKFFNLNRNSKFRILDIDWLITFEYIKEEEKKLATSFWTTRRRRKKIQRLIEEMPTMKQCKNRPSIFLRIGKIIKKAQDLLLNDITKLEKYNVDNNSFKKLFIDDNFGSLIKDEKDLTFIDIIKGIFPLK
ncbi:hypothetical protein RhiirB3_453187 [Rhizophagus irregularis]|nr:hypothetical protein RhiirB3_453187 [Rhizophagus irregularis]